MCYHFFARLILGQWFQIPGVCASQRHTAITPGSEHPVAGMNTRKPSQLAALEVESLKPITGEFHLSLCSGMSIDSPACSPPMKYTSSSPCSNAHGMPRPPRPPTRSHPAMSSSSVPVPTRTGKPLSYWFAVCVLMALSAARSCGRIVAATLWRGIRTARRQSSKSGMRPSLNLRCASGPGATTGQRRVYIILSANRLGARRKTLLGKQLNRRGVGFTVYSLSEAVFHPDNEHYAAPCRSP